MAWIQFAKIPTGFKGTEETIRVMWRLGVEGSTDEHIVRLATEIVRGIPPKQLHDRAQAIVSWIHKNIEFIPDPWKVERVQTPRYTAFERRAGDCDDMATLFQGLARAVGFPVAFATTASDKMRPNDFSHIYPVVGLGGRWVPADPSAGPRTLGWQASGTRRRIWTGKD